MIKSKKKSEKIESGKKYVYCIFMLIPSSTKLLDSDWFCGVQL